MRVLLSGMTSIHVGVQPVLKYVPFTHLFRDALREAGHEVTQKKIDFEEDLLAYDVVILGFAPIGALGARWAYPTLWALDHQHDLPMGVIVDDWKQKEVISSFRRCCMDDGDAERRTFRGKFSDLVTRYSQNDLTPDIEARIMHAVADSWHNGFPPMVGCFHDWAVDPMSIFGPEKITIRGGITTVDPTMMHPRWENSSQEPKTDAWILASLSDYEPWVKKQRPAWDVRYYGNRRHGLARITEEEVFALYTQNWGVLAPPYYHAGSGWWRPRYLMAADAGAIIAADQKDWVQAVPDSRVFCPAVTEVEQMSHADRRALVERQSDFLFINSGQREEFIQEADNWVRTIVE